MHHLELKQRGRYKKRICIVPWYHMRHSMYSATLRLGLIDDSGGECLFMPGSGVLYRVKAAWPRRAEVDIN